MLCAEYKPFWQTNVADILNDVLEEITNLDHELDEIHAAAGDDMARLEMENRNRQAELMLQAAEMRQVQAQIAGVMAIVGGIQGGISGTRPPPPTFDEPTYGNEKNVTGDGIHGKVTGDGIHGNVTDDGAIRETRPPPLV
eukprot:Phypoly_transcript_19789.p1 GENE.Phypoly_transcript_19789~~Phypoly_transcript_19789.p1  ORF type:complete len:140 (+),score=22.01 Phypoly_transcript_19789:241-660(+)